MKLSPKQKAFCEHYATCGNATEAARLSGYKQPNQQGPRLLVNVGIQEYMEALASEVQNNRIATAKERQEFWTRVMRGEEMSDAVINGEVVQIMPEMKDRLKASEILGKAQSDFIERKEITGKDGAPLSMPTRIEIVAAATHDDGED